MEPKRQKAVAFTGMTTSGSTAWAYKEVSEEPSSITEIAPVAKVAKGIYDLQGRRISNGQKPTTKGIYIINGKKVVIK